MQQLFRKLRRQVQPMFRPPQGKLENNSPRDIFASEQAQDMLSAKDENTQLAQVRHARREHPAS